ncbi:MAG: DoxX family protein [Burkholderiales bacterium]
MNKFQPIGLLVGRLLLAYIFVLSGYGKLVGFHATAGYMASKGLPMTEVLLVGTIAIELLGGLMLAVGWKTRWVAWVFFLWLIPVSLVFHNYWSVDIKLVTAQMIQFNKNLAIMGGMLYVAFTGPGKLSLDRG